MIVTDAVAQHDAGLMELVEKQNISCKVLPKQKFEQMAKDKYDVKSVYLSKDNKFYTCL